MSEIWNFFENMNEYVYVSDADTHELIYMNKKMRDTYGCLPMKTIRENSVIGCCRIIQPPAPFVITRD